MKQISTDSLVELLDSSSYSQLNNLAPNSQNVSKNPIKKWHYPKASLYIKQKYQLKEMGYEEIMLNRVYIYLKPKTIEDAIEYMNTKNGIYQHKYQKRKQSNSNCLICGKEESFHINDLAEKHIISNLLQYDALDILNDKDDIMISVGDELKCQICYSEIRKEDKEKFKLSCGHISCGDCWYEYIKEELSQSLCTSLHCFSFECHQLLTPNFIISVINGENDLLNKYERLKEKNEIYSDGHKKFCPHPNCKSYLEIKEKDGKYVKCERGHQYCYVCLNLWHGNSDCEEELDNDFELWKKDKEIKRCPKCKFWTEKVEGCDHLICLECKYHWCWKCEQNYTENHEEGETCKLLQF